MSEPKLYRGDDCPCPSDCKRRGDCARCIAFHHERHQLTYCEFLSEKIRRGGIPHRPMPTGRQIRLTDYGPCAG